jgi:hypothetical protein
MFSKSLKDSFKEFQGDRGRARRKARRSKGLLK